MGDLQLLLQAIDRDLGDVADTARWPAPVEFPDSLALCALNSAYSLRSHSRVGKRVVARYRAWRPSADRDSGPDLIRAMVDAGGPEAFARDVLGYPNSKLPKSRNLCTVGVYEALCRLAQLDTPVETAEDLREHAHDPAARRAWLGVNGLGWQSWSFLLMNAGVESSIKLDVMIVRYVKRAVGDERDWSEMQIWELMQAAARERNVTPRRLDRAIWSHESPSTDSTTALPGG